MPVTSAALLTTLVVVSLPLPLQAGARRTAGPRAKTGIPARFWAYAGFAVLYGICETVNGNCGGRAQLARHVQLRIVAVSAAVAGGVIAFYQLGYGIAAFGVEPLLDASVGLPAVDGAAAMIAVLMGLWSLVVARQPTNVSLHPRLGNPG
jgi:hypothetical protein